MTSLIWSSIQCRTIMKYNWLLHTSTTPVHSLLYCRRNCSQIFSNSKPPASFTPVSHGIKLPCRCTIPYPESRMVTVRSFRYEKINVEDTYNMWDYVRALYNSLMCYTGSRGFLRSLYEFWIARRSERKMSIEVEKMLSTFLHHKVMYQIWTLLTDQASIFVSDGTLLNANRIIKRQDP